MPDPKDYKKSEKSEYMEQCMHQTKLEGVSRAQGVAQCLSVWGKEKGEKKPKRKKQGTHILLKILAQRLAEYA